MPNGSDEGFIIVVINGRRVDFVTDILLGNLPALFDGLFAAVTSNKSINDIV